MTEISRRTEHQRTHRILRTLGLATLATLLSCSTGHSPVSGGAKEDFASLPQYSLHDIAHPTPEIMSRINGQTIETSGHLRIIDQDITYYLANLPTVNSQADTEIEELTYEIYDDKGDSLLATQRHTYRALIGGFSFDEDKTRPPKPTENWVVAGKFTNGNVEVGNGPNDVTSANYIHVNAIAEVK